jgi:two-component system cell cycle response regulator
MCSQINLLNHRGDFMREVNAAHLLRPLLLVVSSEPDYISTEKEMKARMDHSLWSIVEISYEEIIKNPLAISSEPDCILFDAKDLNQSKLAGMDAVYQRFCGRFVPLLAVASPAEYLSLMERASFLDEIIPNTADPQVLASRVIRSGEKHRNLMDLLLVDPVSGAFTRQQLNVELQKQLHGLSRTHESFSMVYLVLDELQTVCHTYGHAAAESLKQQFVSIFKQSMRPTDTMSHFGGEDFILILPATAEDDALKFMKRMMNLFSGTSISISFSSADLQPTFSARVVEFADASQTPEGCLAQMPFTDNGNGLRHKEALVSGAEETGTSIVKKIKIAIIDDDRIIRELLSKQLLDLGDDQYDVETRSFHDGEEYFSDPWHKQNERFIIIIDRIMPKMDGLEVLQKIRKNYDRRRYLCVMLTSRDSETEIAMAIQRGANDYMIKPFSLKELRARLRRLMRGLR